MQNFHTSSYFFPSSPHRMKNVVMDGALLTAHKKQIKSYLANQMARQYHHQRHPQTRLKKYRTFTEASKLNRTSLLSKKQQIKTNTQIPSKMPGVFNLLDKARKLRAEGELQAQNPFYRIQKRREPKSSIRHTVASIYDSLDHSQNKGQTSSHYIDPKLFQNLNVSKAIEQEQSPKTRTKSQTYSYYEIKNYFEQKYHRGPASNQAQQLYS